MDPWKGSDRPSDYWVQNPEWNEKDDFIWIQNDMMNDLGIILDYLVTLKWPLTDLLLTRE